MGALLQVGSKQGVTAKYLAVSTVETDRKQRPVEEVVMFGTQTVQTNRMALV